MTLKNTITEENRQNYADLPISLLARKFAVWAATVAVMVGAAVPAFIVVITIVKSLLAVTSFAAHKPLSGVITWLSTATPAYEI